MISSCNKCRKLEGLHYSPSPTAQLPHFRLEDQHPFTSVGVDFLGPLYVKETNSSTVTSKVYTALYTCATTTCMTTSITTQAVLQSLIRFVGRRGVPKLIVSDNFKSFKTVSLTFNTRYITYNKSLTRNYLQYTTFLTMLYLTVKKTLIS